MLVCNNEQVRCSVGLNQNIDKKMKRRFHGEVFVDYVENNAFWFHCLFDYLN